MLTLTSKTKNDLLFLIIAIFVIGLTWLTFLGWVPGLVISGNDGIFSTQPHLLDFFSKGGRWQDFLIRFEPNGGTAGHSVGSTIPLYDWCAFFGVSSTTAENLCCFFVQLLISFFSFRIINDLSSPLTPFKMMGVAFLSAFAPFIAWRLGYGHEMLLSGFIPLLVLLSTIISFSVISVTSVQLIMIYLALTHSLACAGQQGLFFGFIFGAPLFICALVSAKVFHKRWSKIQWALLLSLLCIVLSAVATILPRYLTMLSYALGPDASRSFNESSVVYSYVKGTISDWLTSIPWTLELTEPRRGHFLWHETNYAIGPMVVFLLLLPKNQKILGLGLLLSATISILFSNGIWIGEWLAELPLVRNFRVPERSFIAINLFIPLLGILGLRHHLSPLRLQSFSKKALIGYAVFAGLMFIVDRDQRELLAWMLVLFTTAAILLKKEELTQYLKTELILMVLAVASVSAFKERLLPYQDLNRVLEHTAVLRDKIISTAPFLNDPLERVKLEESRGLFGANLGGLMKLSSIDGYWLPTSRFIKLESALNMLPLDFTRNFFFIPSHAPGYESLRVLYNTGWKARITDTQVQMEKLGPTPGKAWFSETTKVVQDHAEVAREIKVKDVSSILKSKNLVLKEDSVSSLPQVSCKGSRVLSVTANRATQEIEVEFDSVAENCPLTISLNYLSFLKAKINSNPVPTFPAYGTLLGVSAPQGKHHLKIKPELSQPRWVSYSPLGAALFALLSVFFYFFRSRRFTSKGL